MTDWGNLTKQERIALVQQHHTRDGSASKIAASIGMGVTRNAVVGIYERNRELKLTHPLGGNMYNVAGGKRKQVEPMRKPMPVSNTSKHVVVVRRYPPPPPSAKITRPESREITLLDLKSGECKWPSGNSNFTFCGAPADGSYCRYHARLSYAARA